MRVLTCDPNLEVVGSILHVYVDNLEADVVAPLMQKRGIKTIQLDQWYPAHKLLDMLNELGRTTNLSSTSVAIGLVVGQTVPLPPDMTNPTLPEVLNIWDSLYQMIHRGAAAGGIVTEKIGDKHYKTRHTVIYPDDLSYGVLYGYGRRFLPPGTHFKVYYDESVQRMDDGGTFTDIHIEWQ